MRKLLFILSFFTACSAPETCSYEAIIQTGSICNVYSEQDSISATGVFFVAEDLQSALDAYLQANDAAAQASVSFNALDRIFSIEIINTIIPFTSVKSSNSPNCGFPDFTAFEKTCTE